MIKVTPIPAFQDNYLWLLEGNQETWVVDPGDGAAVNAVLREKNLRLSGILITHHHPDHVGGIKALLSENVTVAGPKQDQHPMVNRGLVNGALLSVCGVEFQVIEVPGHTMNHIAYFAQPENQDPVLFCGDTLFAGGCGRLFEGTPAQMHRSLSILAKLPANTQVYCAHEYTLANLAFALSVEPGNQALKERIEQSQRLRDNNTPTVPSTLSLELETNPFLRTDSPEIIASARNHNSQITETPENIFTEIRALKDIF